MATAAGWAEAGGAAVVNVDDYTERTMSDCESTQIIPSDSFSHEGTFSMIEVGARFQANDGKIFVKVSDDFAVPMSESRFFHPGHAVKG